MTYDSVKGVLYFDTIRNYTLSLLGAFDNIELFVEKPNENAKPGEEKTVTQAEKVPITFANYEKFIAVQDISNDTLVSGNYNFLPRMAISFEGMQKNDERTLNKFNKIKKKYTSPSGDMKLDYAYNSIPYDFSFNLTIQTRGVTQAFQLVERILPYFRPTMPLEIDEMPLFQEWVTTQVILNGDPEFEIMEEFAETDVNIVNVTIPLLIRGNIFSPITLSGPVNTLMIKAFVYEKTKADAEIAWKYRLDKTDDGKCWKKPATIDEHYAAPKPTPVEEEITPDCP